MPKVKNDFEKDKLKEERSMSVYKRDDMIQKARFTLSIQEQRAILYAISKIKPEDTDLTEYTFDIKEFYALCGIEKDTYTTLKAMLKKLSDKSWWLQINDKEESLVRWFNTLRLNKNSGKVSLEFHKDMMPFLIQLAEQEAFYTSYNLQYILPMSCKYSPRLYEILKSYQKNNQQWFFYIDDLKKVLDCEKYENFKDFRKRVLEPAVEEINKYTDIKIAYSLKKQGRKVVQIMFFMDEKTNSEKVVAQQKGITVLDGQMSIDDIFIGKLKEKTEKSKKTEFFEERKKSKSKK